MPKDEKKLKELLFELYIIKRLSVPKIAEILGTTKWKVYGMLKRYNIKRLSSARSR